MSETTCPGCGVVLPALGTPADLRLNASAECATVQAEVAGFELAHLAQLGRFHQLTVDSYGAQHPGPNPRSIRTAYSLVGLYLGFERGLDGLAVRGAHQRMGKPAPWWPAFERPVRLGPVTIRDVAEAGAWAASVSGHAEAMARWGESVWQAWSALHPEVRELSRRLGPYAE